MSPRLFRSFIYVLVTVQLLLSAPVVYALAQVQASSSMPCAGDMPPAEGSGPCPCCPEGSLGTAACLSSCTASLGAIATFELPTITIASFPAPSRVVEHVARSADPPLKPPPIR